MSSRCQKENGKVSQWVMPDSIQMIKTPCKGLCPVYELTLTRSGNVTLLAKENLTLNGTYTLQLDNIQMESIISVYEQSKFLTHSDEYVMGAKDLPITYLEVKGDSIYKRIRFDKSAPEELHQLANELAKLVQSENWSSNSN